MATNINELQERFQRRVKDSLEVLDKQHLRRMQADCFKCSTRCCENGTWSSEDVQNCLTRCQAPVQEAQTFLETELNNYQNRLQRCMMDCSDRVRDRMPQNPSENDLMKYRGEAESCAAKCIDSHLTQQLPALMTRLAERMKGFKAPQ